MSVAAGASFITHLPQQRKLAVFDCNEAKIVKYLPASDDRVLFTAGQEKLVVVLGSTNVIQRWSLATFEREVAAPAPVQGRITAVAMGSATRGPVVLTTGGEDRFGDRGLFFLDLQTLRESPIKVRDGGEGFMHRFDNEGSALHVSNDGSIITGAGVLVRRGESYVRTGGPGHSLPAADGKTLFTHGQLFTAEGKPVGEHVGGHGHMVWYVPALHGPLYVSLNEVQDGEWRGSKLRLSVHVLGDGRPLLTYPQLDTLDGLVNWQIGSTQPFERHVFLIPNAQLLILVPQTRDKLVLHRFDFDRMLEKADIDYLFVQSQPPRSYRPGQVFVYEPLVRSRKGQVTYKLESGPPGMKASPAGKLTWPVPANFADGEANVILAIADASGQEIFHTFRITPQE